jgi:hypothetical protein
VTDRELEIHLEDNKMAAARRSLISPPVPPVVSVGKEEEDPWNAVAVVGLRVYHRVDPDTMKEGEEEVVKVRVIRPNYFVMSEDQKQQREGEERNG